MRLFGPADLTAPFFPYSPRAPTHIPPEFSHFCLWSKAGLAVATRGAAAGADKPGLTEGAPTAAAPAAALAADVARRREGARAIRRALAAAARATFTDGAVQSAGAAAFAVAAPTAVGPGIGTRIPASARHVAAASARHVAVAAVIG